MRSIPLKIRGGFGLLRNNLISSFKGYIYKKEVLEK